MTDDKPTFQRLDRLALAFVEFGIMRLLPVWLGLVGGCVFAVAIVSYSAFSGTLDERARWASGTLQIAGTLSVVAGLFARLDLFTKRSLGLRIADWVEGLEAAFIKPLPNVGSLRGTGVASVRASGRLSTAPPTTGLDEQLRWLIARVDELDKLIEVRHEAALTAIRHEAERLRTELESLRRATNESYERVKISAVGGVRVELTGVLWILIGQAVGAWPSLLQFAYGS